MAFADALGLMEYWKVWPPAHIILRTTVDLKTPSSHRPVDAKRARASRRGFAAAKIGRAPAHIQQIVKDAKARSRNG